MTLGQRCSCEAGMEIRFRKREHRCGCWRGSKNTGTLDSQPTRMDKPGAPCPVAAHVTQEASCWARVCSVLESVMSVVPDWASLTPLGNPQPLQHVAWHLLWLWGAPGCRRACSGRGKPGQPKEPSGRIPRAERTRRCSDVLSTRGVTPWGGAGLVGM